MARFMGRIEGEDWYEVLVSTIIVDAMGVDRAAWKEGIVAKESGECAHHPNLTWIRGPRRVDESAASDLVTVNWS